MITTTTKPTGKNDVTVSLEINYNTPKKGDTLAHGHTLQNDMTLGIKFDYDHNKGIYTGTPLFTDEVTPRAVFFADGYSWREGEFYTRA